MVRYSINSVSLSPPHFTCATTRMRWTEIIFNSTDRRSNIAILLHEQGFYHGCLTLTTSRIILWHGFNKISCISLSRILINNYLQCELKTAVLTRNGSQGCIMLYNALFTMHAGETTYHKPYYKNTQFGFVANGRLRWPRWTWPNWYTGHNALFYASCDLECSLSPLLTIENDIPILQNLVT